MTNEASSILRRRFTDTGWPVGCRAVGGIAAWMSGRTRADRRGGPAGARLGPRRHMKTGINR